MDAKQMLCIEGLEGWLTEGKVYDIIKVYGLSSVVVKDNQGKITIWYAGRFVEVAL